MVGRLARIEQRTSTVAGALGDVSEVAETTSALEEESLPGSVLVCSDSDVALRALLAASPDVRDIEVTGAGLEDAFVQLTRDERAAEAA